MKNMKYSLAVKIAAIFLFFLSLACALGGGACIVYMANEGYYNSGGQTFYDTGLCATTTRGYANTVYRNYLFLSQENNPSAEDIFHLKQYESTFSKDNTNFFFTVTDSNRNVLLSNYEEQSYGIQQSYSYNQPVGANAGTYVVNCYVKNPITAKDNYDTPYRIFSTLYSMRYVMIAIVAFSAVLCILLFIYLMCSAGRRNGKEEIVLNRQDRIPLDLYAAGILAISSFVFSISVDTRYSMNNDVWVVALFGSAAIIEALLALALCMTFAARLKAGKWWVNTIIYRILKLIRRTLSGTAKLFGVIFGNLPLLWKTILLFAAYILINGITFILFLDSNGEAVVFLFGVLFNLAVLFGLCFLILQMHRLKQGGERIAGGDYHCKIDTMNMLWDIKAHAETLNNISAGMSRAVEERLKSERLKTELITNVSHDIKTPLTSIINYVDLLKKEAIDNENAQEYIEVLDRQSLRLKKLTDDIVEASKASTGNIAVTPARTNIVELINQSVGEYAERFAEGNLEPVVRAPENEAAVCADGRLMWRVFDNLLSNIVKYSQRDTRVYLDVDNAGNTVTVTLKNISRYPLNITSEELLERFARGDSSRATEGSGLGLSIAKSLTELQKGSFTLSVDGDLFKVVIAFNRLA